MTDDGGKLYQNPKWQFLLFAHMLDLGSKIMREWRFMTQKIADEMDRTHPEGN
jgi:hypothetical protein